MRVASSTPKFRVVNQFTEQVSGSTWPLPRHLSLKFLKNLAVSSLQSLSVFARVSKRCHSLASDEVIWRTLVLLRHHVDDLVPFLDDWKNTYRNLIFAERATEKRRLQMIEIRRQRKEGLIPNGKSLLISTKEAFRDSPTIEPILKVFFTPSPVIDVSLWGCEAHNVQRIDGRSISPADFAKNFEIPRVPCLLTEVVNQWPAMERWTIGNIVRKYGDESILCAQYSKLGTRIKMTLSDFVRYMLKQTDETPLYVFDEAILARLSSIRDEYLIPEYFWQDLFVLLGKHLRPSYRWILLGPSRSGSGFHFDPNGTTAWNALIVGRKRWTLYPPKHVPPGVSVESDRDGYVFSFNSPDPLTWLRDIRPSLKEEDVPPVEFVQKAGEIVFVPSGWWHQVLNLEPTVCVTHNLANEYNLDVVTESLLRDGNGDLLEKLQSRLKMVEPRLFHLSELYTTAVRQRIECGDFSRPNDRQNGKFKSYIVK